MRIQDIPWWNRPSNRIKKKGEDKLNPAELLSLILWSGKKGENAIDMSNRLLKKSSFSKISEMSLTKLEKEVGKIGAVRIKAMYEIFKITNWVNNKGFKPVVEKSEDIYNLFTDEFNGKRREYFYALFLDNKNRIIEKPELISIGTLDETIIHPREVFKESFKKSAKRVILVHNHPTGNTNPSKEDKIITEKMFKTGEMVGIEVTDHIIIGNNSYYSFRSDKVYNLPKSSE